MAVEVTDNTQEERFELLLDGQVVGLASYRRRDDVVIYPHVEVDPDHEGKGFASQLAQAALEDAERRGLSVIPSCPFMAAYIKRHPEHQHLVAE